MNSHLKARITNLKYSCPGGIVGVQERSRVGRAWVKRERNRRVLYQHANTWDAWAKGGLKALAPMPSFIVLWNYATRRT